MWQKVDHKGHLWRDPSLYDINDSKVVYIFIMEDKSWKIRLFLLDLLVDSDNTRREQHIHDIVGTPCDSSGSSILAACKYDYAKSLCDSSRVRKRGIRETG